MTYPTGVSNACVGALEDFGVRHPITWRQRAKETSIAAAEREWVRRTPERILQRMGFRGFVPRTNPHLLTFAWRRVRMHLPHEAVNRDGVLALFVNLIAKGYRYHFTGRIKAGKDPRSIDERMILHYGANLPKWTRERRKRAGKANFRYIRYGESFFLFATEGEAPDFWRDDRSRIRDLKVSPLRFSGYSISYRKGGNAKLSWVEKDERTRQWEAFKEARATGVAATPPSPTKKDTKWHVRVQIDDDTYSGLKAFFLNIAVHREGGKITDEFQSLNFQPYAPVRDQLRCILRAVNRERSIAGFDRIPLAILPFTRRIVPAFAKKDVNESTQ